MIKMQVSGCKCLGFLHYSEHCIGITAKPREQHTHLLKAISGSESTVPEAFSATYNLGSVAYINTTLQSQCIATGSNWWAHFG